MMKCLFSYTFNFTLYTPPVLVIIFRLLVFLLKCFLYSLLFMLLLINDNGGHKESLATLYQLICFCLRQAAEKKKQSPCNVIATAQFLLMEVLPTFPLPQASRHFPTLSRFQVIYNRPGLSFLLQSVSILTVRESVQCNALRAAKP